jgi:hypothetical protein
MANAVEFDVRGTLLLTGDAGGRLCVYQTRQWQVVRECFLDHAYDVKAVEFAPGSPPGVRPRLKGRRPNTLSCKVVLNSMV